MYLNKTKRQRLKVISVGLCFVFIFSHISPQQALAARSNAGGGDLAEFDTGKWALGTAVSVASFGIGSAVSSGIMNAAGVAGYSTFSDSISSLATYSGWADKYAVYTATSQVSNAIGKMGRYYGWDPGVTLLVSSVGNGIVSGGLSPTFDPSGPVGAAGMATGGMALGAIHGAVKGGILMSLADEKGKLPPWAGPVAGLAGNLVSGAITTGGFSQNGSLLGTVLTSLPSAAIDLGVNYLTEDMGKQDAYIIQQAFSGLYPIANTATKLELQNLGILPKIPEKTEKSTDSFKGTMLYNNVQSNP